VRGGGGFPIQQLENRSIVSETAPALKRRQRLIERRNSLQEMTKSSANGGLRRMGKAGFV
jgi:hypothetical protein